jgi:hypothetical protein
MVAMTKTTESMSQAFTQYAADILGDLQSGLTAREITSTMNAYAVDAGVEIPHRSYPYSAANKRVVIIDNLQPFAERERYLILLALSEKLAPRSSAASKLRLQLIAKYGHLAGDAGLTEVNQELVEQVQHWLAAFPEVLELYNAALQKYQAATFTRNLLDDLRLALEKLLREVLGNAKSLENQLAPLGEFIKKEGASPEFVNMFRTLLDYYAKYQNTYVKHDAAVVDHEVEFIVELTSAFMKQVLRVAGSAA